MANSPQKTAIWSAMRIFIASIFTAILCSTGIVHAEADEYRLGAGDRIQIRVYGEDDLNIELLLRDVGTINYPFLGEVKAAGLTPSELEETITSGLKGGYLVNPSVQISIVQYRPFYINGEVSVPGGYPFQPGLTVAKAVALAQGFTEHASSGRIFIARTSGTEEIKLRAKLTTELKPGDVITVEQSFF